MCRLAHAQQCGFSAVHGFSLQIKGASIFGISGCSFKYTILYRFSCQFLIVFLCILLHLALLTKTPLTFLKLTKAAMGYKGVSVLNYWSSGCFHALLDKSKAIRMSRLHCGLRCKASGLVPLAEVGPKRKFDGVMHWHGGSGRKRWRMSGTDEDRRNEREKERGNRRDGERGVLGDTSHAADQRPQPVASRQCPACGPRPHLRAAERRENEEACHYIYLSV